MTTAFTSSSVCGQYDWYESCSITWHRPHTICKSQSSAGQRSFIILNKNQRLFVFSVCEEGRTFFFPWFIFTMFMTLFSLLAIIGAVTTGAADLVVETKYGKVRGFRTDKSQIFYGIPYAQPPVEDLRYIWGDYIKGNSRSVNRGVSSGWTMSRRPESPRDPQP